MNVSAGSFSGAFTNSCRRLVPQRSFYGFNEIGLIQQQFFFHTRLNVVVGNPNHAKVVFPECFEQPGGSRDDALRFRDRRIRRRLAAKRHCKLKRLGVEWTPRHGLRQRGDKSGSETDNERREWAAAIPIRFQIVACDIRKYIPWLECDANRRSRSLPIDTVWMKGWITTESAFTAPVHLEPADILRSLHAN